MSDNALVRPALATLSMCIEALSASGQTERSDELVIVWSAVRELLDSIDAVSVAEREFRAEFHSSAWATKSIPHGHPLVLALRHAQQRQLAALKRLNGDA